MGLIILAACTPAIRTVHPSLPCSGLHVGLENYNGHVTPHFFVSFQSHFSLFVKLFIFTSQFILIINSLSPSVLTSCTFKL